MRNVVSTSQEAYHSLKAESVREMYSKILEALKRLGSANTEKIAEFIGVEHSRVHKRTSEMERLEMIWRPGGKVQTKSGRLSFLWTVRGDMQFKTDNQAREASFKPNEPSVANSSINVLRQANLFQ